MNKQVKIRNNKFIPIIALALFIFSCEETTTKKNDTVIDSIPKKKEYLSAYKIIYANDKCLDWNIETLPVIELESDTISLNKEIKGAVFFSSDYLRKIAECNNLDYKIAFDIYRAKATFETQKDTVFFNVPYDSLKLVNTTKKYDEYLFRGQLRASFFKRDNVLGYDTMMPINKRIFVLKK